MSFAKRTGKEELRRLSEMLADIEIPQRLDGCLGLMALIGVQMLCSSPQDAAASMHQLARMMEGTE